MMMPKINCKHFDKRGGCTKKPKVFFNLFRAACCEAGIDGHSRCDIKDKFPRPEHMPPPPPQKKRITHEDEIEYAEMIYTTKVLRCNKCSSLGEYCKTHDAYYCSVCNTWLEPKCSDIDCKFCKDRRDNE